MHCDSEERAINNTTFQLPTFHRIPEIPTAATVMRPHGGDRATIEVHDMM
jgi:hypothetical protein